eukprot:4396310-Heterocapsa_arctica.AAC.1
MARHGNGPGVGGLGGPGSQWNDGHLCPKGRPTGREGSEDGGGRGLDPGFRLQGGPRAAKEGPR